jgi:nickel/cobalt transporter (NiCoT) family protein
MPDLPTDWITLCGLVFVLGLKHGFDADHLATIDGMTRLNAAASRPHARWCGSLFSLGHGAVVLMVAALAALAGRHGPVPGWLDTTGAWISISFLLVLGVANLRAVLAAPPGAQVRPVGLRSGLFSHLSSHLSSRLSSRTRSRVAAHPLSAAGVGALFAMSFDTISQTALFALAASRFGGVADALLLGLIFVAGMLVTDGINGWWLSRLLARADRAAAIASRVMGLAVAAISLWVAALGIGRALAPPQLDAEGWDTMQGALIVGIVGASYLLARWLARRPQGQVARA